MEEKWEYYADVFWDLPGKSLMEWLNGYGSKGWEVINIIPIPPTGYQVFFKRKLYETRKTT